MKTNEDFNKILRTIAQNKGVTIRSIATSLDRSYDTFTRDFKTGKNLRFDIADLLILSNLLNINITVRNTNTYEIEHTDGWGVAAAK